MASSSHRFYSIFFPTIDPLFAALGVFGSLFAQPTLLHEFNPLFNPASIVPIETAVCLERFAGALSGFIVLQIFLLRAKWNDLVVWRYLQGSLLTLNVFMLGAMAKALRAQGRLSLGKLLGSDWLGLGITSGLMGARVAFLMGFGVRGGKESIR